MRTLRWILAIPFGLVASVFAGAVGHWVASFMDGTSWYVALVSGVFSAAMCFSAAFWLAPARTKALTWTLAIIVGLLGLASALGALMAGKDRASAFAGIAMLVCAAMYAQQAMRTPRGQEVEG
jgi:hypothetical protein